MRTLFSKINISHAEPESCPEDIMTIARLISRRDWQQLEHELSSHGSQIPIDDPSIRHAVTEDIIVHFAARFQAPLQTISFLSSLYPISLERPDATGRFPIHVAAKWGATPDVINFLIRSNPAAAGLQDDLGKTPMHYVGECYARNYNRNVSIPMNESMLQVVQLLKTSAPKSVNLEDNEGANAIEYALESNADLKVIRSMQRACRDDWREMKTHAQGKKHEDLAKELANVAFKLQREMLSQRNAHLSSPNSTSGPSMPTSEKTLDGPLRIHFHQSTTKATTRAARTA